MASRLVRYADVDGVRTAYTEQGHGQPVVLLHGGEFASFYNLTCWDPVVGQLAERYHVYALDRLGHGYTALPSGDSDYTMQAVTRHVLGFIQKLGVEHAHVVGHSRGAYVALRLALEQPHRARTLTIVDSNSILTGGQRTAFYDRLIETEPPFGTRESAAQEALANSYSTDHITEAWLDELMELAALQGRAEAHARYYTGGLRNEQFLPGFAVQRQETLDWLEHGRLRVPTLVVWGKNDPSAPLEEHGLRLFDYLASYHASVEMHVFNRAGHYCYREHPRRFVDVVSTFFSG